MLKTSGRVRRLGRLLRKSSVMRYFDQRLTVIIPNFDMAATRKEREEAFAEFSAEFKRNGYGEPPRGLIDLLRSYVNKALPGEAPEDMRKRIYKRLWCLMWFGSSIGKDHVGQGVQPTYVFPPSLKRVVRTLLPLSIRDYRDPTGSRVYQVNIGDLMTAKWPPSRR